MKIIKTFFILTIFLNINYSFSSKKDLIKNILNRHKYKAIALKGIISFFGGVFILKKMEKKTNEEINKDKLEVKIAEENEKKIKEILEEEEKSIKKKITEIPNYEKIISMRIDYLYKKLEENNNYYRYYHCNDINIDNSNNFIIKNLEYYGNYNLIDY